MLCWTEKYFEMCGRLGWIGLDGKRADYLLSLMIPIPMLSFLYLSPLGVEMCAVSFGGGATN